MRNLLYIDHFRVFGCHSYIHIPKDERKKLDFKSKKCIFLGYGSTRLSFVCFYKEKGNIES